MAKFVCRDRSTGRVKVDSDTRSLLFLGNASIGGAGSPQSGQIVDDRFKWGTGVVFVTFAAFTGTQGLEPTISVPPGSNVLTWSYPQAGSQASNRPPVSFIYGVQP